MKKLLSIIVVSMFSSTGFAQTSLPFVSYKPVQVPSRSSGTNSKSNNSYYNPYNNPYNDPYENSHSNSYNSNSNQPQENLQVVMGVYVDRNDNVRKHKLKINTVAGPNVFIRGLYDYDRQVWIDMNRQATKTYRNIDGDLVDYYEWKIRLPELGSIVFFNNF